MTHKQHITSNCLFFPDTQMAAFEKEQSFLRKLVGENKSSLPFNLFPPLCPFSLVNQGIVEKKKPTQLIALAPEVRGNWIVRPVVYKPAQGQKADTIALEIDEFSADVGFSLRSVPEFSVGGMTDLPLYPKLPLTQTPVSAYFIIGYIESKPSEQLKKLLKTLKDERKIFQCPEIVTVNIWYHAKVSLKIEYSTGQFYSCFREIEKPMWEKGTR